jgi:hypothetical protein
METKLNQPYQIISQSIGKNEFNGELYKKYQLMLNNENYITDDGLVFQIKTIGYSSVNNEDELNFDNPYHRFYFIENLIFDEKGIQLEQIPGVSRGMRYEINQSVNKAKKWLNKKGLQLTLGKGYQHKST